MTGLTRPRAAGAALLAALVVPAPTAPSLSPAAPGDDRIVLRPDTLARSGGVVGGGERCSRGVAEGAVVVGIDPDTCAPAGGPARLTARVALRDVHHPTLFVLRLFAADRTPPGGAPPEPAVVQVDGDTLLALRAGPGSALQPPGDDPQPIVTTFVVRESRDHLLSLSTAPGAGVEVRRVELAAHPLPTGTRGIAYSPYRDCQVPGEGPQPSATEIAADLRRIRHSANAIRTYSARGPNAIAASVAAELGLAVWAGAWIDAPPGAADADAAEIDSLLALAERVRVAALVVGNEYVLRRAGTAWDDDRARRRAAAATYLAGRLREVRSRLGERRIPVGTAEIAGDVFGPGPDVRPEYRAVLDQADFLLVHLHPFWEGEEAEAAGARVAETYSALARALAQAYPGAGKQLILGETGWPSAGAAAPPGRARVEGTQLNSARYARDFLAAAEAHGMDFFYFAFADEAWKSAVEGGVQGEAWGMLAADRTAKLPVQSVLVPRDELPARAAMPAAPWPVPVEPCEGVGVCVYDEWRQAATVATLAERGTAAMGAPAPPPRAAGRAFVPSGFMGDADRVALTECAGEDRVHGRMSARGSVRLDGPQGWGGVAWLAGGAWEGPGVDLGAGRGRTVLRFWMRGREGGEHARFGATDRHGTQAQTEWVRLGREWRQLEVDVGRLDRSAVTAGFWWVADRAHNPGRGVVEVLIDNVRYEVAP